MYYINFVVMHISLMQNLPYLYQKLIYAQVIMKYDIVYLYRLSLKEKINDLVLIDCLVHIFNNTIMGPLLHH